MTPPLGFSFADTRCPSSGSGKSFGNWTLRPGPGSGETLGTVGTARWTAVWRCWCIRAAQAARDRKGDQPTTRAERSTRREPVNPHLAAGYGHGQLAWRGRLS